MKFKINVEMEVTLSQAIALQCFFRRWNYNGDIGHSSYIAFNCDGDGNFKPHCKITSEHPLPEITHEYEQLSEVSEDRFDFDGIAWKIAEQKGTSDGE